MVDPVSAQSLQPASLLPFVRKYGQIPWDGTKTEQEWRRQSLIDIENVKTMDAVTCWCLVLVKKKKMLAGTEFVS